MPMRTPAQLKAIATLAALRRGGINVPGQPDTPLAMRVSMAATRIRTYGDKTKHRKLARHEQAIAKGCPCRHVKHQLAIIELARTVQVT